MKIVENCWQSRLQSATLSNIYFRHLFLAYKLLTIMAFVCILARVSQIQIDENQVISHWKWKQTMMMRRTNHKTATQNWEKGFGNVKFKLQSKNRNIKQHCWHHKNTTNKERNQQTIWKRDLNAGNNSGFTAW